MENVLDRIAKLRIVPIVSMEDAQDANPLADALLAGGLAIAEVTFRTAAAEQAIRTLANRGDMLVGAGTVLNLDTLRRAIDAGAQFIVTPGFNPKVVAWCVSNKIPITPGCATPTDIEMAMDHGLKVVKFFPAEAFGGLKTLKAIAAPYGMMRYIPTGGIDPENLEQYLKFDKILACGGSWMATKELLAAKQFDRVTELTRQAVEIANRARPS
ncbi:MAG TPA: bifunctional 4-hydroxy-2-oxoglutarate aldolase/2-dehydro-3-deoxy-phosphogluconate aldolase [Tepidisphaeraceae bacterium]|nr:bifunctional 4-hydroxy-2-oxoglutarate aldolase/2-dehydro-3-deoxy-phosphogluconate aldolase [Tepidisphaeraceae bacterium]